MGTIKTDEYGAELTNTAMEVDDARKARGNIRRRYRQPVYTPAIKKESHREKLRPLVESKPADATERVGVKTSAAEKNLKQRMEDPAFSFVEIARERKKDRFAQSLGYQKFRDLIRTSRLLLLVEGIRFYLTKDRATGRIIVWNDKTWRPFADFISWQESKNCLASHEFQNMLQRELNDWYRHEPPPDEMTKRGLDSP